MKHKKNVYTLLFLLLFTKSQREKKNGKNIPCECRRSKKVDSGYNFSQCLPNPKNKFPVKFIFT